MVPPLESAVKLALFGTAPSKYPMNPTNIIITAIISIILPVCGRPIIDSFSFDGGNVEDFSILLEKSLKDSEINVEVKKGYVKFEYGGDDACQIYREGDRFYVGIINGYSEMEIISSLLELWGRGVSRY